MDYKVRRHPDIAGVWQACQVCVSTSQGSKQPVSRKWVSLLVEIPMNEGLPCGWMTQAPRVGSHTMDSASLPSQGHPADLAGT